MKPVYAKDIAIEVFEGDLENPTMADVNRLLSEADILRGSAASEREKYLARVRYFRARNKEAMIASQEARKRLNEAIIEGDLEKIEVSETEENNARSRALHFLNECHYG